MTARTFRVGRAITVPGGLLLEEVPLSGTQSRTLTILTPGELEDLFWTLARHLSRTVDDAEGE